jgi:hypothetical protein
MGFLDLVTSYLWRSGAYPEIFSGGVRIFLYVPKILGGGNPSELNTFFQKRGVDPLNPLPLLNNRRHKWMAPYPTLIFTRYLCMWFWIDLMTFQRRKICCFLIKIHAEMREALDLWVEGEKLHKIIKTNVFEWKIILRQIYTFCI